MPKQPPATPAEGFRYCYTCETEKPEAEFYRTSTGKIRQPCRGCYRDWHRGRYTPKEGATDDPRACTVCGTIYRPRTRKISTYCSSACKARSPARRNAWLRRTYGITLADYERMLAEQGGGCAICGGPGEVSKRNPAGLLHVDHDHVTGRVRGLLCEKHNLLLGQWSDDPALLRRAADYLERVSDAHHPLVARPRPGGPRPGRG
jgi:hypothetical protein